MAQSDGTPQDQRDEFAVLLGGTSRVLLLFSAVIRLAVLTRDLRNSEDVNVCVCVLGRVSLFQLRLKGTERGTHVNVGSSL